MLVRSISRPDLLCSTQKHQVPLGTIYPPFMLQQRAERGVVQFAACLWKFSFLHPNACKIERSGVDIL